MNNRDWFAELEERDLRIERIIWIAGVCVESVSDDLREFMEGLSGAGEFNNIFGLEISEEKFDEFVDAEDMVLGTLNTEDRLGWLVKFATPVRTYLSETEWQGTWSWYSTTWRYSDDFREVLRKGVQWAENMHKKDRHESRKRTT